MSGQTYVKSSSKSSSSRSSSLQQYYAGLAAHKPMSEEREQELTRRYREERDPRIARELVEAHLRLVIMIAREHHCETIPLSDLVQEGNMGLMKAVEKFDPERGVRLISYARWWIRAYILNYIMRNMRQVRMGTTRAQRKLFFNLNKTRRELERQGITPTPEAIAEHLEVKPDTVVAMSRRLDAPDLSLDAPVSSTEGDSATLGAMMPTATPGPESLVGRRQLWRRLGDCLERFEQHLGERDRRIWSERMISEEPLTLRELASVFGVSHERVRQLEARIKRRLGAFVRERVNPQDLLAA